MKYFLLMLLLIPVASYASWQVSDKKMPEESLIIMSGNGELLKAYLWLPENYDQNHKYKAVVMAHGCGGAYYKDEPEKWTANYLAGKYKVWGKLLNERNIVVLLVDSFSTRDENDIGKGVCDSSDPLARPEKIDPISVRPADIGAGIAYLKSREDIEKNKIGVLGFSNGATAALALSNHQDLEERSSDLAASNQHWFELPFTEAYRANLIIAMYPGCGLNGYSPSTQNLFAGHFKTYTDTFLFVASDDSSLPGDTKEKCNDLRILDSNKTYMLPNMKMKVVNHTDHQFDYKENDEEAVITAISRVLSLFESM